MIKVDYVTINRTISAGDRSTASNFQREFLRIAAKNWRIDNEPHLFATVATLIRASRARRDHLLPQRHRYLPALRFAISFQHHVKAHSLIESRQHVRQKAPMRYAKNRVQSRIGAWLSRDVTGTCAGPYSTRAPVSSWIIGSERTTKRT